LCRMVSRTLARAMERVEITGLELSQWELRMLHVQCFSLEGEKWSVIAFCKF
jgi:hypothetical protein